MFFFFHFVFNDTATTEIYTLSLHDALPICRHRDFYDADHINYVNIIPIVPNHGVKRQISQYIPPGKRLQCAGHRRSQDRIIEYLFACDVTNIIINNPKFIAVTLMIRKGKSDDRSEEHTSELQSH